SMTAAASGSRKSILATGRILPRPRQTQAVLQNARNASAAASEAPDRRRLPATPRAPVARVLARGGGARTPAVVGVPGRLAPGRTCRAALVRPPGGVRSVRCGVPHPDPDRAA